MIQCISSCGSHTVWVSSFISNWYVCIVSPVKTVSVQGQYHILCFLNFNVLPHRISHAEPSMFVPVSVGGDSVSESKIIVGYVEMSLKEYLDTSITLFKNRSYAFYLTMLVLPANIR